MPLGTVVWIVVADAVDRGIVITAGAPLPVIIRSLRRSGLGPLSGGDGTGLVVVLVDPRLARGTAQQVADASGRSERWVRRCLAVLEDAALIRWFEAGS